MTWAEGRARTRERGLEMQLSTWRQRGGGRGGGRGGWCPERPRVSRRGEPVPGCAPESTGKQRSVGPDSVTPWTVAARFPCPRDSPGRNTIGVGSHALLQNIVPTQGWNPCLLCMWPWRAGCFPPAPPERQDRCLFCCAGWRLQEGNSVGAAPRCWRLFNLSSRGC